MNQQEPEEGTNPTEAAADGEEPEDGAAEEEGGSGKDMVLRIPAVGTLDSLYGLREIGREALCWQLSSAKPGNGVEQIRDQSTDTYWQSDGVSLPHWIQVHFARRVPISHVCIFLDYNLDESYTPKQLTVQVGMTTQDLVPAIHPANTMVELSEPVGWCIIPLTAPPDPLDDDDDEEEEEDDAENTEGQQQSIKQRRRLVRTHMIRITVQSMHQNGRDTHIRQVQLYGPRTTAILSETSFDHAVEDNATGPNHPFADRKRHVVREFSTPDMGQFSVIR